MQLMFLDRKNEISGVIAAKRNDVVTFKGCALLVFCETQTYTRVKYIQSLVLAIGRATRSVDSATIEMPSLIDFFSVFDRFGVRSYA
jgi:hypothetical protein